MPAIKIQSSKLGPLRVAGTCGGVAVCLPAGLLPGRGDKWIDLTWDEVADLVEAFLKLAELREKNYAS